MILTKVTLCAVIVPWLDGFAMAQQQADSQQPGFRTQSNAVLVPALVKDKNGAIVYGLEGPGPLLGRRAGARSLGSASYFWLPARRLSQYHLAAHTHQRRGNSWQGSCLRRLRLQSSARDQS